MERANNFDALRLLAASMVLVSHCYPLFGERGEIFWRLTGFETGGGIGVKMFFFISGYLVTASIERRQLLWTYVTARAFRILPALTTVVLLSMFVLGPTTTQLPADEYFCDKTTYSYIGNAVIYALQYRLPGVFDGLPQQAVNGSLWTLPIEVTMYVVLAVLFFLGAINRRTSLFLAVAFFAAHVITRTALDWSWENRGPQFLNMPFDSVLGLGLWFWIGSSFWMYRSNIPVSGWLAAAVTCAFVATFHSPFAYLAAIVALPYMLYYAAYAPLRINLPFGDISYGVYLYAWPVTQTVFQLASGRLSFLAMLSIAALATFLLGWLSWVLVERPMLALKRRTSSPENPLRTQTS